jgi:ubiquinone/menaquinone biosynthesis C-methylase UbiE
MAEETNLTENNKYTVMQKGLYDRHAGLWSLNNIDFVVGRFMEHNAWEDYEYLFKDIPDQASKKVLDFGCGPGRNLVKYTNRFAQIDGVDISNKNLENAVIWMKHNNVDHHNSNLFLCNGVNLDKIKSNEYNIVMSTICMQHICVYEIRLNYLKEFYRVLKPGGFVTIQMGYGRTSPVPGKVIHDYYDNNYDALGTNGMNDTSVADPSQIEKDLTSIGFKNFKHYIRPVGPGDEHSQWIYFSAEK